MKYSILYILLLFFSISAFGQEKTLPDTIKTSKEGKVYLDSVEIDLNKIYLNPDNIKEINVYKVEGVDYRRIDANGVIVITRKQQQPLIPLSDFYPQNPDNLPVIFVINEKVIEDITNVLIEATAIKSSKVSRVRKFLHKPYKIVVSIKTKQFPSKK